MISLGTIKWAVIGAAAVALTFQALHIDKLQADLALSKSQTVAAIEAGRLSEAMRGQEQAQDQSSFAAADRRCDARINTARDAASAIEEITHAPSTVPASDGGRPIVHADQLRRIVGQGANGEASSVSTGSNGTKP